MTNLKCALELMSLVVQTMNTEPDFLITRIHFIYMPKSEYQWLITEIPQNSAKQQINLFNVLTLYFDFPLLLLYYDTIASLKSTNTPWLSKTHSDERVRWLPQRKVKHCRLFASVVFKVGFPRGIPNPIQWHDMIYQLYGLWLSYRSVMKHKHSAHLIKRKHLGGQCLIYLSQEVLDIKRFGSQPAGHWNM